MNKKLHTLYMPVAAVLALALASCGDHQAAVTSPAPAEAPIPVSVQPVTVGAQGRVLQYSGLIASNAESRLSFKVRGIISRIFVKEGDHVSAGQLLATLDLTEADAQVQQAQQNLEKAQRDENRLKNLYQDTVATLEQLQNVHTQLNVATESLRIASFNRQYARIHASANGAILQKIMNEGEFADAGSAVLLFNGTAPNDWVVRFGVSDKDWAVLHKGDKASIFIDAYPDQHFAGTITKLAEGADASGGTYGVEVSVSAGGQRLAPGLFCTLRLQPPSRTSYSFIPASALAEAEGNTGFVYTLNAGNKKVRKIPVHVAYLQGNQIAIDSGLNNVREVVTEGVGYLTDGAAVQVHNLKN